jgi:hypothetical protein
MPHLFSPWVAGIIFLAVLIGFWWLRFREPWWRLDASIMAALIAFTALIGFAAGETREWVTIGLLYAAAFEAAILASSVVARIVRPRILAVLNRNERMRARWERDPLLSRAIENLRGHTHKGTQ